MAAPSGNPKGGYSDIANSQESFGGRGVNDLFGPMHLNFKCFGMTPLDTFACYDVLKSPDVANDFIRYETHWDERFPALT